MYREIFRRFMKSLRGSGPRSIYQLVFEVVNNPAPRSYISEERARQLIYAERRTIKRKEAEMTPCPQVIESVLKENEKKTERNQRPPTTRSGEPARPQPVPVQGGWNRRALASRADEGEPLVADLLRFGSLAKYLYKMKSATSDEACAATLRELSRLRCRHDFPFWAASTHI